MHSFKRTEIEVDIYGTVVKLRRPLVKEADEIREKTKDLDDEKALNYYIDILEKWGLPKDISQEMEVDHFLDLIELLVPKKKK